MPFGGTFHSYGATQLSFDRTSQSVMSEAQFITHTEHRLKCTARTSARLLTFNLTTKYKGTFVELHARTPLKWTCYALIWLDDPPHAVFTSVTDRAHPAQCIEQRGRRCVHLHSTVWSGRALCFWCVWRHRDAQRVNLERLVFAVAVKDIPSLIYTVCAVEPHAGGS